MNYNKYFLYLDKALLLTLLGVIIFQFYLTFKAHESNFENPEEYVNKYYKNDFISQYGTRFTEAKNLFKVPTTLSYVGETNEDVSIGWTNYFLTQYYLAPNLVLKNNSLDTIIYNLYSTKHINVATNFHLNNGWHIVKDFNNGLIVLAK